MSYELIKKYQAQYEEFTKIDDFNLESITKRVPAEKHFWVCRLIDAKIEKDKLYKQKEATKQVLQKKLVEEAPVKLNKQVLDDLDKTPSLENINQKIKEQEYLIEYLEKLVNQITFIGNDIKNIINIKQLQELG
jgi:Na+-translocating ferredoxin:NAD+ oxidoreductase RnfG subunit